MIWPASVERWRPLIGELAGDNPVEHCMAHTRWESGGNAASLGTQTEVGIFQVDLQDGPRYGGTLHSLHNAFSGGLPVPVAHVTKEQKAAQQKLARKLTRDEEVHQVTVGIAMITDHATKARKRLDAVGAEWSRGLSDFWMMVKLHHGLPGIVISFLPWFKQKHGTPPGSWSEWTAAIQTAPKSELATAASKYGAPTTMNYYNSEGLPGFSRFFANAEKTGQYGGGAESIVEAIAVPAVVALGAHVAGRGKR